MPSKEQLDPKQYYFPFRIRYSKQYYFPSGIRSLMILFSVRQIQEGRGEYDSVGWGHAVASDVDLIYDWGSNEGDGATRFSDLEMGLLVCLLRVIKRQTKKSDIDIMKNPLFPK